MYKPLVYVNFLISLIFKSLLEIKWQIVKLNDRSQAPSGKLPVLSNGEPINLLELKALTRYISLQRSAFFLHSLINLKSQSDISKFCSCAIIY